MHQFMDLGKEKSFGKKKKKKSDENDITFISHQMNDLCERKKERKKEKKDERCEMTFGKRRFIFVFMLQSGIDR